MDTLADHIERYLRQLLLEREPLEIQRRQLAIQFRCAPSQINYVLATRFTNAHGYLVETRRGGGGYIRIYTIPQISLVASFGERLDPSEVPALLKALATAGAISRAEAGLLAGVLGDQLGLGADSAAARARILRTILTLLSGRQNDRE